MRGRRQPNVWQTHQATNLGAQKFQHLSRLPASKGSHSCGGKSSLDELLWDIIRRFAERIPSQKELPKVGRGSHIDLQSMVPQYLSAGYSTGSV